MPLRLYLSCYFIT